MGSISRKKSGNIFAGSKLNVPGQGIYNIKVFTGNKVQVNEQRDRVPRPSQTPSNTSLTSKAPFSEPILL